MTRNSALQIVTETINACDLSNFTNEQKDKISEALETITTMREQLAKPRANSTATNEKRKAATAKARTELVALVAPVLREVLTHTLQGLTAKEIYSEASAKLPTDFNWQKVQNVLLREMREELDVIETKNKANVYRLK